LKKEEDKEERLKLRFELRDDMGHENEFIKVFSDATPTYK